LVKTEVRTCSSSRGQQTSSLLKTFPKEQEMLLAARGLQDSETSFQEPKPKKRGELTTLQMSMPNMKKESLRKWRMLP